MTTILKRYETMISAGDPYVRQYFFLRTITPMITTVICYVSFVTLIGPTMMKYRKPFQIRKLIIVYNFSLVAYYVYFLLKGAHIMYYLGLSTFCDNSLDSTTNPIAKEAYLHVYVLYMVKFVELIDTIFLVLSKKFKMITPLHVFHHSIVPVFGWFGLRSEKGTYLSLFMGINSFVHVVMYTYYSIAALGPEYQKYIWWKKYLTGIQIAQFSVMTFYLMIMYWIGCVTSKVILYATIFLSVLFFFLFIRYYRRTFLQAKKTDKPENDKVHMDKKMFMDKMK